MTCATRLARHGAAVLLLERKEQIGAKVCAGGITWSGLLQTVPEILIERSFPQQHVTSRLQNICVSEEKPIIATINRKRLGRFMADRAMQSGVTIKTATSLRHISPKKITVLNHTTGNSTDFSCDYLVGADGASSAVRRYLGIAVHNIGIGINYQINDVCDTMEWHLDNRYFKNGYGWIFPHRDSLSVGAYLPQRSLTAVQLQHNLHCWARTRGFDLSRYKCSAGLINFDFQGYCFGRYFLIGDAGGFASALTGEGIYPAIISGEAAADKILSPHSDAGKIRQLISRQKKFKAMVGVTAKNEVLAQFLAELGVLGLRTNVISFTMLEMSH